MGFILIKGRFYIDGYSPDGDSVKFAPNNAQHLKKLKTDKGEPAKPKLSAKGHLQLRIEGIDAPETHYTAGGVHHQPWDLASDSRKTLIDYFGFTGVQWGPSESKVTGVNTDGMEGYILTKYIDNNRYGRPVSFAFKGTTSKTDGSDVFLDVSLLKKSVNYHMLQTGYAYPTYYKNFYADLRKAMTDAVRSARNNNKGIWKDDLSTKGFTVQSVTSITEDAMILPKLFRRLMEHLSKNGKTLSTFKDFLEQKNDELFVLGKFHSQNLNNLVEVKNKRVKLLEKPENIIFMPQG